VIPSSLLQGDNAAFLDTMYRHWSADPSSVPPEWRAFFESMDEETPNGPMAGPPGPDTRSIFAGRGAAGGVDPRLAELRARVTQMINAFRVRGHFGAKIDPLGQKATVVHPELTLEYFGLTPEDLSVSLPTTPVHGMPATATIGEIRDHLQEVYCGSIGVEFMNIDHQEQKLWLLEKLETLPSRHVLHKEEELRILRKLNDAENFEGLIHRRFPGTKRFSLEGGETLIPLMDIVIGDAAERGVKETVIGMAHRGRLNVLTNILEKPAGRIIAEFEDSKGFNYGSGDVKYHLGYSSDIETVNGKTVHVSLTPNPSHLEAVNSVVEGRVRAKMDRAGDPTGHTCLPILLHGDAAFIGQGVVAEVLQLSELAGYKTGGTLHIVVNNQVGFTTSPNESRSSVYATDMARMLAVPIFHVNGEDPRAVAAVARIATEWRQTFQRDVVIDMYCYRKYGHNEGDEPSFTQPLMYEAIRKRPTPRAVHEKILVELGDLSQAEADEIRETSRAWFDEEANRELTDADFRDYKGHADSGPRHRWAKWHVNNPPAYSTGVPAAKITELLLEANTIPAGFHPHRKVKRLVQQRVAQAEGERPIEWAVAEQAAFATLLAEGYSVRLSGQDCGRGTFSHRHAVWTDTKDGSDYFSLQHLSGDAGHFAAIDSSLSEVGVLGFEYGYSLETPDGLVLWEAQFGDFANGAQVMVDQFISSAQQKWNRASGLVMLLPHGFEGQGPEHSSARIERYLQLCAQDNMVVANCTTPANYFHILRRQVIRASRAPLILMTPKSLLRHPDASSTLADLSESEFQEVIADPEAPANPRRVVLCSGKVYYDLLAARREGEGEDVAIHRVEQLYPFPADKIRELIGSATDVVWTQEEPENMGAWPVIRHWFLDQLSDITTPRYIGRQAAASPATGSHRQHVREQATLIQQTLSE